MAQTIADDNTSVAVECSVRKIDVTAQLVRNIPADIAKALTDAEALLGGFTPPEYSLTFAYSGADQQFTVPAGVNRIIVHAWGAGAGYRSGSNQSGSSPGGYTRATVLVTPSDVLTVVVGQRGGATFPTVTTYGGGGGQLDSSCNAGFGFDSSGWHGARGSGGGLSGVFEGGEAMTFDAAGQVRALVVAGGGGVAPGGLAPGGALIGGTSPLPNAAMGGTQVAGGAAVPWSGTVFDSDGDLSRRSDGSAGGPLMGGAGGSGEWSFTDGYECEADGAGGGGGYFGGAGMENGNNWTQTSGGGSSYTHADAIDPFLQQGLYIDPSFYIEPASEPKSNGLVVIEY